MNKLLFSLFCCNIFATNLDEECVSHQILNNLLCFSQNNMMSWTIFEDIREMVVCPDTLIKRQDNENPFIYIGDLLEVISEKNQIIKNAYLNVIRNFPNLSISIDFDIKTVDSLRILGILYVELDSDDNLESEIFDLILKSCNEDISITLFMWLCLKIDDNRFKKLFNSIMNNTKEIIVSTFGLPIFCITIILLNEI